MSIERDPQWENVSGRIIHEPSHVVYDKETDEEFTVPDMVGVFIEVETRGQIFGSVTKFTKTQYETMPVEIFKARMVMVVFSLDKRMEGAA